VLPALIILWLRVVVGVVGLFPVKPVLGAVEQAVLEQAQDYL
jgi:hypothetical protein